MKLSKRNFLLSLASLLGAPLAAQQWKHCTTGKPGTTSYVTFPTCLEPKEHQEPALNSQCPVCGAMAEPYRAQKTNCCGGEPVEKQTFTACYPEWPMCEPDSRLIRCKRCNAAFWQDTERKK